MSPDELPPEILDRVEGPRVQADLSGEAAATVGLEPELPALTVEQASFIRDFGDRHGRDADFGGISMSRDRSKIEISWHGLPPAELSEQESVDGAIVAIRASRFPRGELISEARRIVGDSPGWTGVFSAGPNSDNSGIIVGVDETLRLSSRSSRAVEDEIVASSRTSYPIEIEYGPPPTTAAFRWSDISPFVGGSRVFNEDVGNACSTAFPVENDSTDGLLTAAHCGDRGGQWLTGLQGDTRAVGTLTLREPDDDGALIAGEAYFPAIYWGDFVSSSIVSIFDSIAPFDGMEICYSGAYSGSVCGNEVTQTDVIVNLGGDLNEVNAVRSEQVNDVPAAGNGDSGGPGITPVAAGDVLEPWATTIISAIPIDSSETCTGFQGGNGRRCSDVVFSTDAREAARGMADMRIMTVRD